MKIVPNSVKRFLGKRWFGIPGDNSMGFVDPLGVPPTKTQKQTLDDYQGIVYSCISAIAEEVASVENIIKRPNARGEEQILPTHAFLKLLEKPNPDLTKFELIESTQSFMEMVGECFWYFVLGEKTREPKEIYIIRPDKMKLVLDTNGDVVAYKLMKNAGDGILLSTDEVYHHKTFNPLNPYRGLGTLQAAAIYVNTEKFASRFTMNFLYNNATPAGILSLNKDVSKETYEQFKRKWNEGITGTENAGRIAIVRGMESRFEKIGLSLGDIDLKALKELSDESIMKMFRIPKSILGISDTQGLGRASVETLEYVFMKRVVEKKMGRLDDSLQKMLDKFYPKEKLVIGHKNIVPEDKEFELKKLEVAVDKWITRDEARVKDDMNEVGAKYLYTALNQTAIEGLQTDKNKKYSIKIGNLKKKS